MRLIFLPNESTLNPFNCEKFLRILGSSRTLRVLPLHHSFPFLYRTYRLNCDLNSCQTTNLKDFWSPTFVSSNDVYLTTANSAFRNDYFGKLSSLLISSLSFFLSLSNLKNFVSFSFFQITIVFYKKDASYLVFEQR